MPLRRKACDSCFKGRRKCDLTFPACERCQRNKKVCRYGVSLPKTPEDNGSDGLIVAADPPVSAAGTGDMDLWLSDAALEIDSSNDSFGVELMYPSVPSFCDDLGELQPVVGSTQSWKWIIEQYRSYPRMFAQHGETVFINKILLRNPLPRTIRAAYGVCAAYTCVNEGGQSMLFRTLDAEMAELSQAALNTTILEDLLSLQAMILYQIIRLYSEDIKQRILAENQQRLLGARAMKLLQRANVELRTTEPSWATWILAESIRRTVMLAFMIYGVYSIFKHGVCLELPTMAVLPVSTKQAFWSSQESYLQHSQEEETMKYIDFTSSWIVSASRKLGLFEKTLLVACKGIEMVEVLSGPDQNAWAGLVS